MTTVSSNTIRYTISVPPGPAQSSLSSGRYTEYMDGQVTRIVAGTLYNDGPGFADEPPARILAYSGMAVNPLAGRLYLFGGGHADYWGNEVWEMSIDDPGPKKWRRHYAPTYGPVGSSDAALIATISGDTDLVNWPGRYIASGKPIGRHTYYSVRWIPGIGKLFCAGGSYYSGSGHELLWSIYGNTWYDQWLYDPLARAWDFIGIPSYLAHDGTSIKSPVASSNVKPPAYLWWHPTRNTVYGVKATGHASNTAVLEFDSSTRIWTELASSTLPIADNNEFLAILHVERDSIVLLTWGPRPVSIWEYALAGGTWQERAPTGVGPIALSTNSGDNAVYSTYSRMMLIYSVAENKLFRLDPSSWTWETVRTSPFPNCQQAFAMDWDTLRGVGFLVYKTANQSSVDVYAFRA